jgi:hypothetical protein
MMNMIATVEPGGTWLLQVQVVAFASNSDTGEDLVNFRNRLQ